MSPLAIGSIIFACVFGSALLGMLLRWLLPEHHLAAESRDTVKVGIGLIGTMSALVLGLMVGSAKSSYDAQKGNLAQMSAKIVLLDRGLAHYGPDAKEPRDMLRTAVERILVVMWPGDGAQSAQLNPTAANAEALYDQIQAMAPQTEAQRSIRSQALSLVVDIGNLRWLLFQQSGSAISTAFIVVLVFWLSVTFAGFGLMAPANATTIVTLLLCALSVAGAVFLVLELDRPFDGILQIPSTPLRNCLAQLGR